MADYATTADCPWNNAGIISKVTRVIVEDGVTTLSNNGFTGFTNVADVIFNGDVLSAWPSHTTDFANSTVCYVNYSWTGRYTDALATFHFDCGSGLDWTLSGGILAISKTKEGTGTFYNYQNANEVPWRNDVGNITAVVLEDGVADIGSYVLSGINATTLTLAESVTHICGHAFDGSLMTEFTVPASVTTIDAYAFANSGLTAFVTPSFMTEIPEGLFDGSSDLSAVTFATGTTAIGANAFRNTGLTEITFPATLTTIGANAFGNWTAATNVYCSVLDPGTLTWTSSATDFKEGVQFHVVYGTVTQWQSQFPSARVTFVGSTYSSTQPFEIASREDWNTFCDLVSNVSTSICANLTADVDLGSYELPGKCWRSHISRLTRTARDAQAYKMRWLRGFEQWNALHCQFVFQPP